MDELYTFIRTANPQASTSRRQEWEVTPPPPSSSLSFSTIRPTDANACVVSPDLTVSGNTIQTQSKEMQRWYALYEKKAHPYQLKEKARSTKSVKKSKPGAPAKPAKAEKAGSKSARPTSKSTNTSSLPEEEEARVRKKKHYRGCMRYYCL